MKILKYILAGTTLLLFAMAARAVPSSADIVFIVDESGSMGGEHAFLQDTIDALDAGLGAAGVGSRSYGLVGYGRSSSQGGPGPIAHTGTPSLVGLADAKTALNTLITSGSFEDGWQAIDFALNNLALTSEVANFVLVTDEDRDNGDNSLTKAGITAALLNAGIPLNAIINAQLRGDVEGSQVSALGVDSDGTAYLADGSGGYNTTTGGVCAGGSGLTCSDYFDIASATGGASWDLNQLRAGGLLADSFTTAFLDIKIQEIISTPPPTTVPEPSALALFGFGSLALGLLRGVGLRRRRS